ncbi:hypothetical protein Q1695_009017 [Nippostrongylus brasiliensis]|nr:hypothetical protein Q1695_009017 [Nippostrongylus brasiliensis]
MLVLRLMGVGKTFYGSNVMSNEDEGVSRVQDERQLRRDITQHDLPTIIQMNLLLLMLAIPSVFTLTCYNGMKLMRMQAVGESVEECPASAYCYNMTASAAFVVDVVKAGCSTWRCMLARDKCISTVFQMVPVSLCCCSHDRCNVAGNPVYDALPSSGGNDGWGSGGSQNSWDNKYNNNNNDYDNNGNNHNNNNGWGNNNDNIGSPAGTPAPSGGFSPKQIKDRFRDFDIDDRHNNGGGGGDEETFESVDWRRTTPPTRNLNGNGGSGGNQPMGREVELDD